MPTSTGSTSSRASSPLPSASTSNATVSPRTSPLPSLLRRHNLRAAPAATSSSLSVTTDSWEAAPSARASTPTAGLKRAPSATSLSSRAVARPVLTTSTSPSPVPPPPQDAGDESDSSGELSSLLQRVTSGPGPLVSVTDALRPPPSSETSVPKSDKARGKQKEEEEESGLLKTGEEEEDDDEAEIVERHEGQVDPREMLRAQLRRNESRGKVKRRDTVGSTAASDVGSVVQVEVSPTQTRFSKRRYFILSTAGKLVFTTDEDEEEATGYVGVMQAIISIFADEGDKLRYVDAGETRIAFLLKPPLYLVCSSDWGEPESVLRTHLDYLYLQVLSVVTQSQLTAIFARRSNFDLRRLMEGTEAFFTTLTETLQTSLPILTSCLEVYRIEPGIREDIAKVLSPGKVNELLYAIVVAHARVVTLVRPKKHSVHPSDLHLLLSTIASSSTFRTVDSEAWIPICLPRFNAKGFLHAYISYASEGVGVVFVSGDREGFFAMKKLGESVKERLRKASLVHKLEKARVKQDYSLGELAVPGVRHFLYKSKPFVQVTSPAFEGDYVDPDSKFRLITLYQRLHETLHPKSPSVGAARAGAKLIYLRTEHEAVLGWTTSAFELYLAVSPLLPHPAVVSAARAVTRWVKQEEASLFLTSAPSF